MDNDLIRKVIDIADLNNHKVEFIDVDEGTMKLIGEDDTFIKCYLLEYGKKKTK